MAMAQLLDANTERRILERLRALPSQQLDEVMQFIDSIVERRCKDGTVHQTDEIKRSIQILRGRGKGEQLVSRLLQSRRDDLRHDE